MAKAAHGDPPTELGKPSLADAIAAPFVAAKAGDEEGLVSSQAESCEEELRHPAISGRNRVIRRLQRRVKSDAHALVG
jgi:hypothetical protein